jgi:hypothetical protein
MNSLTIQDPSLDELLDNSGSLLDELPDNIQDPSLDELPYISGCLFR